MHVYLNSFCAPSLPNLLFAILASYKCVLVYWHANMSFTNWLYIFRCCCCIRCAIYLEWSDCTQHLIRHTNVLNNAFLTRLRHITINIVLCFVCLSIFQDICFIMIFIAGLISYVRHFVWTFWLFSKRIRHFQDYADIKWLALIFFLCFCSNWSLQCVKNVALTYEVTFLIFQRMVQWQRFKSLNRIEFDWNA